MKRQPLSLIAGLALALFIIGFDHHAVQAKDSWTTVHSKNFTLVGNASEKDIRNVANRLEQFRAVFALLFPTIPLRTAVPTTVIVFKSDGAFKPFKPNLNDAGYFQPGEDVNYIALASDKSGDDQPYRVIFHEYVHLMVNNAMGAGVPLWFNEGLAEYYSTFDIKENNRRVILGDLIANHVLYLRENKFLPLRTLFAVDYKSPYYNEGNKMNIFYAESWMLMHYLLQGDGQKHRPQLARFVDLLRAGTKIEDAFQQAFQSSIDSLEKDFKNYIQAAKYMATGITFEHSLDFDAEMQAAPLAESEAHAYLGDLLLHTDRLPDAESQLQQALALDANSSMAQTSYGMLRVRQGRMDDARPHLEKAVASNSQNYLTHYYYAFALSNLSMNEYRMVSGYPEDVAATMRSELKKAIALKPDFVESYSLLGFVNLVRNEQVDETIDLLKQALNISQGNHRVLFMLAQLYMRKEKFAEARQLVAPIVENSPDPELRRQAEALTEATKHAERQATQIEEMKRERAAELNDGGPLMTRTSEPTPDDMNSALARVLRKPQAGEQRVQGILTAIDCNAKGITFEVRVGDRLLKFHSDNFERMAITAFTNEVGGDITCGARKPENPIVLTYAPPKAGTKLDGEVSALEFVPPNFVLKN
ncbi:MAG TPA: tetratricopeptide repeat protein [Pyrinomonadaceae bacterium]|jgi:tetratricopeptide (TPR) repeat protein|nr:tetratricopeptide repeat protein [Pyrinomonadaceae bacterium]